LPPIWAPTKRSWYDCTILELKDLDVFYGPIQALKKVSLHINEGETVSLIGSNGAGKSTLLMSIFGQPRARRADSLSRRRHHPKVVALHRLQRHRAIAGRAAGVPRHDRRGKPADGHHPDRRQVRQEDMQRMFELFPRLKSGATSGR
jgi:branched-chain amino acid transport system ATP-binding protein